MRIFRLLIILAVLTPLIEVYLLIKIGGRIGSLPTIALIILTAITGVWILRHQGLGTISKIRHGLDQGQLPAAALVEGLLLLIAGVLLLTPGFLTDTIGFLCLIPRLRTHIALVLLRLLVQNRPGFRDQAVTLEGEFRKEDH
jgi:UPF0716 protein FxsA